MNFIKNSLSKADEGLASIVVDSSHVLMKRILNAWPLQVKRSVRVKYRSNEEYKKSYLQDLCLVINEQQIEFQPVKEKPAECQLIDGEANLLTCSLNLKFKIPDIKVNGTMKIYNSSESDPCKSLLFEFNLKDTEFQLVAGLDIQGDSFWINMCDDEITSFNLKFSTQIKKKAKKEYILNTVEDENERTLIEKFLVDRVTISIINAVKEIISEECVDMSVCSFLDNEIKYRNMLRLHKKKMNFAFGNMVDRLFHLLDTIIKNQNLSEVKLPNLFGKLLKEKTKESSFKATEGFFKGLSCLQRKGIIIQQQEEDIILTAFLDYSKLNISYKHLSVTWGDSKATTSFNTPDECFSSCLKSTFKIREVADQKIAITLLDFKVVCLWYNPSKWHLSEKTFDVPVKEEFSMWLNHTLDTKVSAAIEEMMKLFLDEVLKNDVINTLDLDAGFPEDDVDSDLLNEDEEEEEYEQEEVEEDDEEKKNMEVEENEEEMLVDDKEKKNTKKEKDKQAGIEDDED